MYLRVRQPVPESLPKRQNIKVIKSKVSRKFQTIESGRPQTIVSEDSEPIASKFKNFDAQNQNLATLISKVQPRQLL